MCVGGGGERLGNVAVLPPLRLPAPRHLAPGVLPPSLPGVQVPGPGFMAFHVANAFEDKAGRVKARKKGEEAGACCGPAGPGRRA